jgi:hypothetical protein
MLQNPAADQSEGLNKMRFPLMTRALVVLCGGLMLAGCGENTLDALADNQDALSAGASASGMLAGAKKAPISEVLARSKKEGGARLI